MAFLLCTGVSADAQDTLSRFQSAQKTAEAGGWTRARQIFEEIAVQDPQLPEAAWNAAFLARKTEQWEICEMYYRFYLEREIGRASCRERLCKCAVALSF